MAGLERRRSQQNKELHMEHARLKKVGRVLGEEGSSFGQYLHRSAGLSPAVSGLLESQ